MCNISGCENNATTRCAHCRDKICNSCMKYCLNCGESICIDCLINSDAYE